MKNKKFAFVTMLLFASMAFLVILGKTISIKAASEEPKVIIPSTEEAYAVAPKGVKLKDYVVAPEYYKNTSTNNDKAFKSSNVFYLAGDDGNKYANQSDIIQLLHETTTPTTQIGSVWGNIKDSDGARTYNYFDLNKDQELSAWIYNGDSGATTDVDDGFAFVLQTDPNGTQAISRSKGAPVGGETLGVWGGGTVDNVALPSKMMSTDPIRNSMAIEFDKILNINMSSKNDYMDYNAYNGDTTFVGRQVKENHISWGYPGDEDIYLTATSGGKYYYYMKHRSPVKNGAYMSGYDGVDTPVGSKADPKLAWRHIQIKYKASTSKLTYSFNDKFIDGTPKVSQALNSATLDVDKTKFTNNRAYWGFTAATGSPNSLGKDFAIVMEKMPAVADVNPSVLLTDETKETTSEDGKVAATDGDDLRFDYTLKYNGGISPSGDITTTIALPEHVDYDGDAAGNIGKIIYTAADGSPVETVINKSQIKNVTVTIPGKSFDSPPTYKEVPGIEVTVPSLEDIGDIGKVEIYGKAHAPESTTPQTTTVAAAHANFESESYTGTIMSPEFTISNEKLQITNTNDLNQSLKVNETAHFKGTMSYALGSTFDASGLKAKVQVYDEDGKSINADLLGDIPTTSGSKTGTFDIPYELGDLEGGKTYTFKVTLTDSAKRQSNTLVYTVKVADIKKLKLAKSGADPTIVERSKEVNLKALLNYDDNSTVDSTEITTYLQVDDETPISGKLATATTGTNLTANFDIKSNSLSLGTHTVKVYATDGKRTSNVLEYDFKVVEHGLILTPDKETIDVRNNDPVNLGWNVKASDEIAGTTVSSTNYQKATLKIKNEGDTDFHDFYFIANDDSDPTENVDGKIAVDSNGDFDFDVYPINYSKVVPSNNNKSYLDQLKEGRNEIKFQVSNGDLTSEEKTVVINVPKLTPSITSPRKIVYLRGTGSMISIPVQFEYKEDSGYTTKAGQVPILITADNGKTVSFVADQPTINEGPPLTFDAKGTIAFLGLNTKEGPYTVHISVADPYGRQGQAYDLTISFVTKILELEVNDYTFEDISFRDKKNDYINRQGHWRIAVDSLGAKWDLKAKSSGLFNERDSSYYQPLVFLNKDGQEEALTDDPIVAQRTKAVTIQDQVEDITEDWDDDDGILLKNNMPNLSGRYSGEIQWTLTEAP